MRTIGVLDQFFDFKSANGTLLASGCRMENNTLQIALIRTLILSFLGGILIQATASKSWANESARIAYHALSGYHIRNYAFDLNSSAFSAADEDKKFKIFVEAIEHNRKAAPYIPNSGLIFSLPMEFMRILGRQPAFVGLLPDLDSSVQQWLQNQDPLKLVKKLTKYFRSRIYYGDYMTASSLPGSFVASALFQVESEFSPSSELILDFIERNFSKLVPITIDSFNRRIDFYPKRGKGESNSFRPTVFQFARRLLLTLAQLEKTTYGMSVTSERMIDHFFSLVGLNEKLIYSRNIEYSSFYYKDSLSGQIVLNYGTVSTIQFEIARFKRAVDALIKDPNTPILYDSLVTIYRRDTLTKDYFENGAHFVRELQALAEMDLPKLPNGGVLPYRWFVEYLIRPLQKLSKRSDRLGDILRNMMLYQLQTDPTSIVLSCHQIFVKK